MHNGFLAKIDLIVNHQDDEILYSAMKRLAVKLQNHGFNIAK